MKHMKGRVGTSPVVLMLVMAMVVGALAVTLTTQRVPGVQVARAAAIEQSGFSSFSPVVKRAMPAVVNISSSKVVRQQQMPRGMFDDPFFRPFFGGRPPQQQPRSHPETRLRSGVVVSADRYTLPKTPRGQEPTDGTLQVFRKTK